MELKLTASLREPHGKRSRALRAQGKLPGVVYGHRFNSTPVLLDAHEFERMFTRAGRTHLVDLVLDGKRAQKVLVREVQYHPRARSAVHVDLLQVDLREKLTADVPVRVTGESPAAKRGDADLVQLLNTIKVECLPSDIPEAFEVDVSELENVGDVLRVKDVPAPTDKLTIVTDAEEVVVKNQARRLVVEEEEVAAPEEAAEELPEATSGVEPPAAEGTSES